VVVNFPLGLLTVFGCGLFADLFATALFPPCAFCVAAPCPSNGIITMSV